MPAGTEEPSVSMQDVPLLIGAAFDVARAKGKVDWHRMTTAVLNNRLLQMTNRRFDLASLGFSSVGELLEQFPDLVRLDHTTRPTTVEFLGDPTLTSTPRSGALSERMRVRDDLWNAILNYTAGHDWVWDAETGEAHAREVGHPDHLVMPTMSRQDLGELRAKFASVVDSTISEQERERLERWRSEELGTAALPSSLRGSWNEHLKSAVVNRLTQWFHEQGISPPDDLTRTAHRKVPQTGEDELARLRALVIDCVRVMTLTELASLNLPAGVVLRARSHHVRDAT